MRLALESLAPSDCVIRLSDGERVGDGLNAVLMPVNIASIHVYVLPADTNVKIHYHDFDEYWVFSKGCPTVTIRMPDGRTEDFALGPGDMVAAPAGVEHTLRSNEDLHYFQFSSHRPEGARCGHIEREES